MFLAFVLGIFDIIFPPWCVRLSSCSGILGSGIAGTTNFPLGRHWSSHSFSGLTLNLFQIIRLSFRFLFLYLFLTALRNVLEAMIVELSQKAAVSIVRKVGLQNLGLFKTLGHKDTKSASMRTPVNARRIRGLRENVMNLLDIYWFLLEIR